MLVKWFREKGEAQVEAARALRSAFEAGELVLFAPALIYLELINLAGRRWGWSPDQLNALARSLSQLRIQLVDPDLERVARWTSERLTAYDSAYVAVAEAAGLPLVTADETILRIAAEIARPLALPS